MKIKIESDGTTANTKIFINDELIGGIQYLELVFDADKPLVEAKNIKINSYNETIS